jgi:hypothetical protein
MSKPLVDLSEMPEILTVELEGSGPVNVIAWVPATLVYRARYGSSDDLFKAILYLAQKLDTGQTLTDEERTYLAQSLRRVADDVGRYGKPFGPTPEQGRPASLGPLDVRKAGRWVEALLNPSEHGHDFAPFPQFDNDRGPGAFTLVAEKLGVSESTVRRAHKQYLARNKKGPKET